MIWQQSSPILLKTDLILPTVSLPAIFNKFFDCLILKITATAFPWISKNKEKVFKLKDLKIAMVRVKRSVFEKENNFEKPYD